MVPKKKSVSADQCSGGKKVVKLKTKQKACPTCGHFVIVCPQRKSIDFRTKGRFVVHQIGVAPKLREEKGGTS